MENISKFDRKLIPPQEYIDNYTEALIDLGYLTKDKIRAYPLSKYSYHVILKLYALQYYKSYDFTKYNFSLVDDPDDYYVTDKGLTWVGQYMDSDSKLKLKLFGSYFMYNRLNLGFKMNPAFNNIKGISGKPVSRYTNKALLILTVGRRKSQMVFDNVPDARKKLTELLRYYTPEQFVLWSLRTRNNGRTYEKYKKLKIILTGHDPELCAIMREKKRLKREKRLQ